MKFIYSDEYDLHLGNHVFPSIKYRLIKEKLLRDGIAKPEDIVAPPAASEDDIALEGALKLKEISYIHAEGYPAGEMKHGPNALITEGLPVVVVATCNWESVYSRQRYERTISNIKEAKARGASIIALVTEGDTQVRAMADHLLVLPHTIGMLSTILETVPLQLLAYHIGVLRGCDVDQPRNLAKSVTVE